jgi:hypothetical protein
MVDQRGSILVAVVALSVVLALAAGSLMMVVGNSQFDEDSAYRRQQCLNDAESGLMMGVGWLRYSSADTLFVNTFRGWAGNSVILFQNMDFDNGSKVTVSVTDNAPAAPGFGLKTVVSSAVNGSEMTQLSLDVDAKLPLSAVGGFPTISLSNWRSP